MDLVQRLRLRREVRKELMLLRLQNRNLDTEAFRQLAEEHLKREYEGIDPDNLKLILELLKELLPIIIQLLPMFI